jgi:hypothetical protein
MYYVLKDLNDPTILKTEDRTSAAGTICPVPVVDGKEITDIDILKVVDTVDPDTGQVSGQHAVVSLAKQELKDNLRHAKYVADLAVEYKEKRRAEYPSELDVIEALIEDKEGRPAKLDAVKATRAEVKLKYPKPE